jgi:flagella basal body P-ring formation protein FlgA
MNLSIAHKIALLLGSSLLSLTLLAAPGTMITSAPFSLTSQATVDSQGIHLDQVATCATALATPHIRLADSPALGQTLTLSRAQIQASLLQVAPDLATTPWQGSDRIRITRRTRLLDESDLRLMLVDALQKEYVRDNAELELRFARPWASINVPDEALDIRIIDVPISGISANFIARFELRSGKELVGTWQAVLQARLWKDVLVAADALKRGQIIQPSNFKTERRDTLAIRDALSTFSDDKGALELTDSLAVGTPLVQRMIRLHPVVHRGDFVEGMVQDGILSINLKVEVLEEGAPGQTIRVRNPLTKRELRGKVKDEQTIVVTL